MKQHPLDLFLTTAMPRAWVVVLPIHEAAWLAALLLANYINLASGDPESRRGDRAPKA